tara:strand:+ start:87 stop:284 length:198 start_codon:yes stop_codon:yes gene_type:complete
MVKTIIIGAFLLISSPVLAFENENEGMDFFYEALENVKQYHLEQTMTKPEDALDKALDDFWNTYE